MSHKNNNNEVKDTNLCISPKEVEQCFFAIEADFQDFEKMFMLHHLRKRTNFKLKTDHALRPFGIKFLFWFLKSIHQDLGDVGSGLCQCIMVKLSMHKGNRNWLSFESNELFEFKQAVKNL